MKLIIEIKLNDGQIRKYPVTAESEEAAIEKMKLRLHPKDRDLFEILSIKPDPLQLVDDDIHGTFLN